MLPNIVQLLLQVYNYYIIPYPFPFSNTLPYRRYSTTLIAWKPDYSDFTV